MCVISIISNRSVLCIVFIVFVDILVYIGEILEILGKSSDFFNIFSDLTSIYCEIHEILIICIFVFLSLVCVQVGSDFRSQRGIIILYLFSETIGIICFIHYIVHLSGVLIRL